MRVINRRPSRGASLGLAALPFALALAGYLTASSLRLAADPKDKFLPSFASFADALHRVAFTQDFLTGHYLLFSDTGTSLLRLLGGLAGATLIGGVVGLATGMIPYLRSLLAPFIAVLSVIPPLAVLPILLIVFGLGEVSKVVLIIVGIAPFMIRDMALRVEEMPIQQLIKAQTLGASSWQIALRVVVPQMLPRLIDAVRLSLGSAWLYLISAEAIASDSGLGYRIFLVRRYLAMDVILPYVAWITLLAFLLDLSLRLLQRKAFPWFAAERSGP